MGGNITTIGLDADDTLWHNEAFFRMTEARFVELLSDFTEAPALLERLLAAERRNLHRYGYGVKGFVLSMVETAVEVTEGRVSGPVIGEILAAGRDMLAHPVDLLPDVRDTVAALARDYRLVLITKGDLMDQERKIAASGIDHLFDRIEVVSDKTPATYARIFGDLGGAQTAIMAGNSMKSDVLPALAAGAHGVFIPFAAAWALEHADAPQDHPRFHTLDALSDLPALLHRLS
jgi:putative hydrolase of the HAD superfamily